MKRVYLDHNATSPLRVEARAAMLRALGAPGNASSIHADGHAARMVVESARTEVAALIGAATEEVVLTAGGTEANNLAIYGAALSDAAVARHRIVTTAIEHPSVLAPCADLESRGFEVIRVRPDRHGVVAARDILEAAGPGTALVSFMLANNETGVLQPVAEVGAVLRSRGVLLHCDAAQTAGRIPLKAGALNADLISLAAHKFGGPQGVGALYVRRGLVLRPHLRGGGQEQNRRPGTENIAGLAGMGAAAAAARGALAAEGARLRTIRDHLEQTAAHAVPGLRVHGAEVPRIPNTTNLGVPGSDAETLVIALDLEGFAVSSGSACSSGTVRRSHVLEAMGLGDDAGASIRVSLGLENTPEDVDRFVTALSAVAARIRVLAADRRGRP